MVLSALAPAGRYVDRRLSAVLAADVAGYSRLMGADKAWGGKTANLTSGRKDPVAGDDQRHRIPGHGLTDIARSFWPGAELLRQGAIGCRAAPSDPPRRGIDLLEERVLLTEVERNAR